MGIRRLHVKRFTSSLAPSIVFIPKPVVTMADAEAAPAAPAPVKVVKEKKAAKPKKATTHPSYNAMIKEAIAALKEKGGSSRQAILKYIIKTHKIKADNVSGAQLKLALKRGVASGDLKQSKGTGASGSFKLGVVKKAEKPKKKVVKPKKAAAKSPKKAKKPKVAKPAKKAAKSPKKAKKPAAKKAAKPKAKAAKKSKK